MDRCEPCEARGVSDSYNPKLSFFFLFFFLGGGVLPLPHQQSPHAEGWGPTASVAKAKDSHLLSRAEQSQARRASEETHSPKMQTELAERRR